MDKELFIFVKKNMEMYNRYRLYTKQQAEGEINGRAFSEDRYTLCRLVPCSVSEEPITVTKKVIV